jgi:hypothetical protein
LVKESLKSGVSLRDLLVRRRWFEPREVERVLDPHRLTTPQAADKALQKRVAQRLKKAK